MADIEKVLNNGDTVIFPDRRNGALNLDDLYKYRLVDDGPEIIRGKGKYVAKQDDIIWSFTIGWLRVVRVDESDYHVDLQIWKLPNNSGDVDNADELLGVGPGSTSEGYRVYIDTRVFPYRLDINSRLHTYSPTAKEVMVFVGTDTGSTGEVISAYYASDMTYIGPGIPVVPLPSPQPNNTIARAPTSAYTSKKLKNGAPVTVVTYNQMGSPIDIARMLVHNTNIIRHPDDYVKRVKSVEVVSPYLSKTEPNVLEVPLNSTVASLALRGKVTYTTGESYFLDVVDELANGKLTMIGLAYWSPQIPGELMDLQLNLKLNELEEYSYLQGETANGTVQVPYFIKAMPVDPARTLKLFTFPVWKDSVTGYVLEHWLTDLARQIIRKAPKEAVSLVDGSGAFDGLDYTTNQRLRFGVDLGVVDPAYAGHKFAQLVQISLLRSGGQANNTNWKLKFSGNQSEWYGEQLQASVRATTGGLSTVNVKNGMGSQADWLKKMYWATSPLYDPQTESKAPEPTHFILTTKTRTFEVPVTQWAMDISIVSDLKEGETMYVKWIKRTYDSVLMLGVSGLPVHAV